MSAFDLGRSPPLVERWLEDRGAMGRGSRPRRDRGEGRFAPEVEREMSRLLSGRQRPVMSEVHRQLATFCRGRALPTPSRSSLYNVMRRVPVPAVAWSSLPEAVRRSLYNLEPATDDASIAGDQVVFYAFNYGEPRALSFASGLPWLCLVRAEQRRGWRPKSRALLRAVMAARGLR